MIIRNILYLPVVLLIVSCATPYFGYSKTDWDNFTEEERTEIQVEYRKIIAIQKNLDHTDIINDRTQSVVDLGESK
ncbi:MAG: hypothetical protein ACC653_11725 [Gammaproteobacteria bacterium]